MHTLFRRERPKTIPCPAARPRIGPIKKYLIPCGLLTGVVERSSIIDSISNRSLISLGQAYKNVRSQNNKHLFHETTWCMNSAHSQPNFLSSTCLYYRLFPSRPQSRSLLLVTEGECPPCAKEKGSWAENLSRTQRSALPLTLGT